MPVPNRNHHTPTGAERAVTAGPLPRYQQVKSQILDRIASREWSPGARIPSENELVRTLAVSRMTAHRAMRELAAEGYVVRVQGLGTFVAPTRPRSALVEIRSIADEIAESGGVHASRVLFLRPESAPPEVARILALPPGVRIFHSLLLHTDRGVPMQLADRWVNPQVAPDYLAQDFTRITPSRYLLNVAPVTEAEHVIEAVRPNRRTRELLSIEADEPCLVLHRTTWVRATAATHSRFTHPGSRYRIGGRFRPTVTGGAITG